MVSSDTLSFIVGVFLIGTNFDTYVSFIVLPKSCKLVAYDFLLKSMVGWIYFVTYEVS